MATVKVKGLKELRKSLNRKTKIAINKVFRQKQIRQGVASILVESIRDFIFNSASPATQRVREYLETYNSTHPNYDRRLINITFTGDLLNDLIRNAKADTTNLAIIIEHSQKPKKGYKTKNGRINSKLTYQKLSKIIVEDKKYDYFKVSAQTIVKIKKFIISKLESEIVKELNS